VSPPTPGQVIATGTGERMGCDQTLVFCRRYLFCHTGRMLGTMPLADLFPDKNMW